MNRPLILSALAPTVQCYSGLPRMVMGLVLCITAAGIRGQEITITGVEPDPVCAGGGLAVAFELNDPFNGGNEFTVWLSDASGDFGSEQQIGSLAGNVSETIDAVVPLGVMAGSGFRVRVKSTDPEVISDGSGPFEVIALLVFPGSYGPFCSNGPAITLGGTPSGGVWTGIGVSGNGPYTFNPSVGTQTLTYTATSGSCSDSAQTTITVNTAPAQPDPGTYGPLCSNDDPIDLAGDPEGGTWTGIGVTGNQFNPSVGTQALTYSITNASNCTSSASTTVTVTNASDASITYNGSPFCASIGSAAVTQSGSDGGSYTASPFGLIINVNTGELDPEASTPGTYTVTYEVPANGVCPIFTTSTTVTIVSVPELPIVADLGADTLCHGQVTSLFLGNDYPAGTSYSWSTSGPAEILSGADEPICTLEWTHAPPSTGPTGSGVAGSYTVAVNVGGCANQVSGTITVLDYYASCPKGIVFFEPYGLAVIDPVANHFQWGAMDATGATFTPIVGEVDQIMFRPALASLAGGLPVAPPYVVRSSIYADKCFSYTARWVDQPGLDRECLVPTSGMTTEPGHTIYPNPGDGKSLTVEATGPPLEEPIWFELYDMQGQQVHAEQVLVRPVARLAADLSGLGRGMYVVRLHSSGMEENLKLILD
ncbi:MAG: T9SS type A sorting domain-containing protein [Flavobacteriales bacterium]